VKTAALLAVSACTCMAAIGNLRVLGTTATQALIAYTAPDGNACTIQLSQSAGLTPPALDVDPGTFANSNSDLARPSTVTDGLSRTVVLGQRTAQLATAGPLSGLRHFSRSLQAYTPYFGQLTCPSTGDTATFTFTTSNIPLGQTYGDPWLADPTHPGDQPWPESVGGLAPESFIDPLTGTLEWRIGLRGNQPVIWNRPFGSAFNQGQTTPCDTAGPWTSPCNVAAGSGSTTVGNSTAPLVLRPSLVVGNPWNTNYGSYLSLDEVGLSLTGYVNSTASAFRVLDFCLSMNGGMTCASPMQQITMGQASSTVVLGDAPTSSYVPVYFGVDEWLLDSSPRINLQESAAHSGTATVTNNSGTYTVTHTSGDSFSLYWIQGGNGTIRLSSNNDACITPPNSTTSNEYRIGSFTDGLNIVLAAGSTPPTGAGIYWCENNFTVMVWRDQAPTDGSTVTLTAATLNASASAAPSYPDNGVGTACLNTQVDGGFFCLYGNMYWINDSGSTPTVVYYGVPQGQGKNAGGTNITNSWNTAQAPMAESASIDQAQSNLTFYMVANDPAGASPLVIQGVYQPSATPTQPATPTSPIGVPQIQNATVTGTTAYSVTWSNGMTFTNLTPQSSMAESVFQQATAVDSSFNPSWYTNLSCGRSAAFSQGVFLFACWASGMSGDAPAEIFALSPGDGNPAHAGQAGGPRIVGAINTFNTPPGSRATGQTAITGRALHAFGEDGGTGWFGISANIYPTINTSTSTSLSSSGPEPCTYYGLTGNTNDCVLIQIDSHTVGSVTGYEPYLPAAIGPFLGTPGELRTAQIGDTACVAASGASSCDWTSGKEMLTLQIKNYGSTNGAWVFQRNALNAIGATTVSSGTNTAPIVFSVASASAVFVGESVIVAGSSPSACNGSFSITALSFSSNTITVNNGTAPGSACSGGTLGPAGTETAVTAPIKLFWQSYQSIIPPGSTPFAQTQQVWWNPLTGCNGSPDPNGNCLIQASNEDNAHGEWRVAGEAQAVNVSKWQQPIWGWPFDYQVFLGQVPCIFALPFANNVPGTVTVENCVSPASSGINYVAEEPPFAGVYGHPWGNDGGAHPNPAGDNASAYESIRFFDNIPVQGGQNEPTFTAVSGQAQLYVATPTSNIDADDIFGYTTATGGCPSGGCVAINRKLMATAASCGSHPVIDVSGPSSSIAAGTAGSYTYCIVRANGECYPPSTTGQIYVNCPGVVTTSCAGSGAHGGTPLGVGNDICIGNIGNAADAIVQYSMDQTDEYGATRRQLVSATSRLRMVGGFENNRLLPDNSWILYRQEFLNYQRMDMWMAKLPPYPAQDSVARGTFVQIPVNAAPPAGLDVNNAIVEFGYQEYGAPQLINCTTRNDACIATETVNTVTPGNQPFYFASENPAGAPCATGCTIFIPAISQRILYYQVKYRSANNTVLAAGPPAAVVVP